MIGHRSILFCRSDYFYCLQYNLHIREKPKLSTFMDYGIYLLRYLKTHLIFTSLGNNDQVQYPSFL